MIFQEAREDYAAVTGLYAYYNIIICIVCYKITVSFCVFGLNKIQINDLTRFLYLHSVFWSNRSAADDIIYLHNRVDILKSLYFIMWAFKSKYHFVFTKVCDTILQISTCLTTLHNIILYTATVLTINVGN